ncbi:hypothetical protein C0991_009123 [Blastosporella zonata]|nr:hypothetical protein C0991_009123 [Blastosporella zonata]
MSYTNGSTPPYPPLSDDPNFMGPSEPMESDEIDDEVDQLVSDSDASDAEGDAQSGAGGQRVPGQTLVPPLRLQNIMSADETIPVPVPLSEAIKMREAKEKELFDADPTAPPTARPSGPSTSMSASAPRKAKSRLNGAPKHDRRSDKGLPRPTSAPIDSDSNYSDWTDTRPPRTGGKPSISVYNGRLSVSARPSPLANGHSVSAEPSRSGTLTPAQSHDTSDMAPPQHQSASTASPFPAPPEPYTGPASGFLQGSGGPFARVAQNPGRTIYSQQYHAE